MQELLSKNLQCVARDFSTGVGINPGTQKEKEKEKRFKGRQAHSFMRRKKKAHPMHHTQEIQLSFLSF